MSTTAPRKDQPAVRKVYTKPQITHELRLETRAGSTTTFVMPGDSTNPFDGVVPQR